MTVTANPFPDKKGFYAQRAAWEQGYKDALSSAGRSTTKQGHIAQAEAYLLEAEKLRELTKDRSGEFSDAFTRYETEELIGLAKAHALTAIAIGSQVEIKGRVK